MISVERQYLSNNRKAREEREERRCETRIQDAFVPFVFFVVRNPNGVFVRKR
jgi:hypothetical protein